MGMIRDKIKELDESKQLTDETRELINSLMDLAQEKANTMENEIKLAILGAGKDLDQTIPIDSYLRSDIRTAASTSDSVGFVDKAKEHINKLSEGGKSNIIDGVCGLVGEAVEMFLGSSSAGGSTMKAYYIVPGDFGQLFRLDIRGWKRDVEATSIKTKVEKVSAYCAVFSAVDMTKISFSVFMAFYGKQLKQMKFSEEQAVEALKYAKSIIDEWKALNVNETELKAYLDPGFAAADYKVESLPASVNIM
ncbi:hypothetical protein L1D40_01720 [Shewanella insulae]|uniref:hypothetical protein n=1 Tax=Shewanella TaxID=22 RepID=UPI001EFEC0D8|nr:MULTISPECIES: hypothetical protein [Shewanella]MCG9713753.1 hypothetical protein [Shewanella insulae]MCG9747114.1 hypothetical protein [Shewanella sp. Isolate8]MCG9753940.1 hypothetical protein [Shewanella insulae]MCL2908663.1 hypothetical protein [Shewanella aquimarina]